MEVLTNIIMSNFITEINTQKIHKKRLEFDLISIMNIIWPDYVFRNNVITFANVSEDINLDFIKTHFESLSAYEDYENHIHIIDIHEFTLKQTLKFGLILKDIWKTKLEQRFPNQKFVLVLTYDGKDKNNTILRFHKFRKEDGDLYGKEYVEKTLKIGIMVEKFG